MNTKHYYCWAVAALLALALSATASAATVTWTGLDSNTWDEITENWSGAGSYYTNGYDAVFNATGPGGTISVVSGIEPNSTTVAGGSYAFQNAVGNSGTTIGSGPFAVTTGGAANVSGADLNCSVTVDSSSAITVGGGSRIRGDAVIAGAATFSSGIATFDGNLTLQGGLGATSLLLTGQTLSTHTLTMERFLALGLSTAYGGPLPGGTLDMNGGNILFDYYGLLGGGAGAGKLFDGTLKNVGELGIITGGPLYPVAVEMDGDSSQTLVLAGVNNFSGDSATGKVVVAASGTIALGNDNAIPHGIGKHDVAVNLGATLDLAGHNATINGLTDWTGGGGKVDNTGAGAVTLTVGDNNASSTFDGTIQNTGGNLSLTKVGTGTVIVNNPYFVADPSNPSGYVANTYQGATTVVAGTLQFNQMAAKYSVFSESGQGIDIQGGKAIDDYHPSPAYWSDPISFLYPILQYGYQHNWTGAIPIRSSTADAAHGLGYSDDTADGLFTVMYTLYGDADLNGTVNGADLNTVLSNYNKTGMSWSQGDFNYDGIVNGADLNMVLSNYNQSVGVGAAVPEPSTLLLAAAGLAGLLAYARRKRK